MADDITVEADSGGHTDNRPLVLLLPTILELRDQFQLKYNLRHTVNINKLSLKKKNYNDLSE